MPMMEKKDRQPSPVKNEFTISAGEAVPVRFERGDPDDPVEGWSKAKRWRALALAMLVTYASAFNASGNGAASAGFRKDHPDVSSTDFQISSFTYLAMLGIGPLILAPVSETFGRRPQIVICTAVIAVLFVGMALAPNLACLAILRWIQGTAACIEGPTAAGCISDLTRKQYRGPAMTLFVLTVFTANATGPLCMNWVAFTIGWKWVYWCQLCLNFAVFVLCLLFFPEPRADVILEKRCKKLTKETGRPHFVEGGETFDGWVEALKVSSMRPIKMLFTEPIVAALALYVGMGWGAAFLLIGAIAHVFEKTYGFNQGQGGTVLICGCIGAFICCILHNVIQEPIYQRAVARGHGRAKPEVRLYPAAIGSFLFSGGCFFFAWTARPFIHWIVPCIGIVILNIGIYSIYLCTYLYLGDVYDKYSSSAQAGQSLLRNLLGVTFPFFGVIMYDQLGFPIASTVMGGIAGAFIIVPWVLIFFGEKLRKRSKIAMAMELREGDVLPDGPPGPHLQEIEP